MQRSQYIEDSIGIKQGKAIEMNIGFPFIYEEDKFLLLDFYIEIGCYLDYNKEGMWEIWSIDKDEQIKDLVALSFYIKNKLIYSINLKNNNIMTIYRYSIIPRYNNKNYLGTIKNDEIFFFNNNGKLQKRCYYAPDGIFEIKKYK